MYVTHHTDLANIKDRQAVIDLLRATDQVRCVSFGNTVTFQSIGLRHKDGTWQVQDTAGKWYTKFWCES